MYLPTIFWGESGEAECLIRSESITKYEIGGRIRQLFDLISEGSLLHNREHCSQRLFSWEPSEPVYVSWNTPRRHVLTI